jgi:magnesium-transporting ATPase (P-type)
MGIDFEEDAPESPPAPWSLDASALATALDTDTNAGLASPEAASRLRRHGRNELQAAPLVPAWRRLLAQFRDPLVYLLLAAVLVSLAAWLAEGADGPPFDAIVIAAIVLANGALGYFQEARAEEAVAALQRMAAPLATVVRDGEAREVPAAEVVPGDLVLLDEGDAVPADARLVEAASLQLGEAPLTGESQPVLKDPRVVPPSASLGDRSNMVFAGTAVLSGRGKAVATATGMGTEMGAIARLLAHTADEPTPLQREVRLIGRVLGLGVLAIAAVVVAGVFLTADISGASDLVDVLLIGVSLAVAAVPEGLPVLLTVVLALGVRRMARQRAIVRKLAAVESLGSASIICTDKTGTLTRNEMTVTTVVTPSGVARLSGTGYRPVGEVTVDGQPPGDDASARALLDEVRALLGAASLACNAVLHETDGEWTALGDPTEAALLAAEAKLRATDARGERFTRLGEVPFTAERKLMSTLHRDTERGTALLVTKGAPDVLLARCTTECVSGAVRELTEARRAEIHESLAWLAGQALRPLAVACREFPGTPGVPGEDLQQFEHALVYLGMVGIIDPPRPEAAAAVGEAKDAGIRVVMITGDHPRTALRIAADLGLARADARVLTGVDLESLDDASLRGAAPDVPVYARVAPRHKLRIVDALQARGEVVAMTGDGVNDAPALRSADIGVAMGITGTDVTKEAADMILTDDNFATIVAAIREGRGIFANIRTFLRFLLSSNIGEVLTMFLGVMAGGLLGLDEATEGPAVPLLATQILWINLLTDTAPALALGVDPPARDLMRRPPRRPGQRVLDAGMQRGIAFVGLVMAIVSLAALDLGLAGGLLGGSGDIDQARTMAFTTLVLAQLYNCFNARSDRISAFRGMFRNRLLLVAVAASLALQVAVVQAPGLNDAFGTTPLSLTGWVTCAALASSVLWANELRKLIRRHARPLER